MRTSLAVGVLAAWTAACGASDDASAIWGPSRGTPVEHTGFAPDNAASFAGVTGTATLQAPWAGTYRVHYVDASTYEIAGSGWIPDSRGGHTYTKTGDDTADMVFEDNRAGRVTCAVRYTSAHAGESACRYPNGVTLSTKFTVP